MLLPTVRTILTVLRLAADELAQELVALVLQLLVNADLRRVVATERCILAHDEEFFERCFRRAFVAADVAEDRVQLCRVQTHERRVEALCRFGVERRETANPLKGPLGF